MDSPSSSGSEMNYHNPTLVDPLINTHANREYIQQCVHETSGLPDVLTREIMEMVMGDDAMCRLVSSDEWEPPLCSEEWYRTYPDRRDLGNRRGDWVRLVAGCNGQSQTLRAVMTNIEDMRDLNNRGWYMLLDHVQPPLRRELMNEHRPPQPALLFPNDGDPIDDDWVEPLFDQMEQQFWREAVPSELARDETFMWDKEVNLAYLIATFGPLTWEEAAWEGIPNLHTAPSLFNQQQWDDLTLLADTQIMFPRTSS
jgi:hypothetical protein